MRYLFTYLMISFFLLRSSDIDAQDIRINRVENFQDTSQLSNTFTSRFYFQYTPGTLTPPFTFYFKYSVNGKVQPAPLDSFTYGSAVTTEVTKDIIIQTNSPVYRKGDNIVVVWPICYQASHSGNSLRRSIFIADSIATGLPQDPTSNKSDWQLIFDQERRTLQITHSTPTDFPLQLHIYDNAGKMVWTAALSSPESTPIPALPAAIYLFEMDNTTKKSSGKIILY
jgi:hypothetical protein